MYNNKIMKNGTFCSDAGLNKYSLYELEKIASGVSGTVSESGTLDADASGSAIGGIMRLDDIRDAAERESNLLTARYGLRNASEISTHMAISTRMPLDYRGNRKLFLEGFASDVEEIAGMYFECLDIERQQMIKSIRSNRCKGCLGDCEFCSFANYRRIDRTS